MIQTIVERIYIVDKDDERFCHIFIKGCTDEDYTGFFQTAGYIEQNTVPVCDSEQHCIYTEIQKRILYGRLREDVKEIISTLCKYRKVDIIAGAVCKDHVHLSVAIPPKESISDFMGYLKGKSTLMIYDRYPELQSKWDKAFWARRLKKRGFQ